MRPKISKLSCLRTLLRPRGVGRTPRQRLLNGGTDETRPGEVKRGETVCGSADFDFSYNTAMDSSAEPKRPARLARAAPFLTALFLALTYITIPRQPFVIDDALSEKSVLSYAHEHGMQFGTDIVFTYGPLGFLTTRHFFPQTADLRMAVDVLLSFAVSVGVCLTAWRLRLLWRCLL